MIQAVPIHAVLMTDCTGQTNILPIGTKKRFEHQLALQFESVIRSLFQPMTWYNTTINVREDDLSMNLSDPSLENVEYMLNAIKSKLKMAVGAAMQASHYDLTRYEDLKDIYEMVAEKENFSISEIEAIASELGKLRKA